LEKELESSTKHDYTFSVIILDLDNFKNYNDNNGHIRGSEALRKIATIMKKVFRSTDILAKYGGDEFVTILSHTDKVGAFLAADRLREVIEKEPFIGEGKQPNEKLTISLGIASFPDHGKTAEEILNKADKAMYFAKEIGKNKTILYSDDVEQRED
jgi:diguanylate cyclase (GGDEF)-like protein